MSKGSLNEAHEAFNHACDEHVERYGRTDRVYISGRMSGVAREEYLQTFKTAEKLLRKKRFVHIVNPIRVWVCRWPWMWLFLAGVTSEHTAYTLVLLYDLWLLSRCDTIYMMPGWRESRGANIEYHFASLFEKNIITKID